MNGIEDAIRWIELQGIQHWKVSKSRGDKNDKAFETNEEDQLPARILQFRETMKLYPGNYFYITGKKSKTQTTGLYEYEFLNGNAVPGSTMGATPQLQVSGIGEADIQKRIDEALERAETKRKIEELEKQNKELQKEVDENGGALVRMYKQAEPIIGMLINKMVPAKTAVTLGTVEHHAQSTEFEPVEQEEDTELTARVQAAIDMWAGADADFLEVLEFISDFAANQKSIDLGFMKFDYAQIKEMLLKSK